MTDVTLADAKLFLIGMTSSSPDRRERTSLAAAVLVCAVGLAARFAAAPVTPAAPMATPPAW